MNSSRKDQVFGVSLSEIAFTLLFLLMLLLGFMVISERNEKEKALDQLRSSVQTENAQAARIALVQAEQRLIEMLKRQGVAAPEKLVAELVTAGIARVDQARQTEKIEDLNRRLVALDRLRLEVERAGGNQSEPVIRNRVESALAIQEELRKQVKDRLNRDIPPGQEIRVIADLVEGARALATAANGTTLSPQEELGRLRAQVAFYQDRDKLRGLMHPPCWIDAQGRQEFIFNVQTTPDGFIVSRGWPSQREADARASSGFDLLTAKGGSALTVQQFSAGASHFLEYGKKQSPECRHLVYLSTTIDEANKRDEARLVVNRYFYVSERKTPVIP